MLFLLSPAKSLDYESPLPADLPLTPPTFTKEAAALIKLLKVQSPQQIAQLMHLSDKLAALNVARYTAWSRTATAANARQALWAFNGDVYGGLNAPTLTAKQREWAQEHLCMLSGLYGVLRPFDALQPYRLEMGTPLANAKGDNLYAFWKKPVAQYLNERLAADKTPVVVNLASQEYFKAVDTAALKARVVDCVFQDDNGSGYKVIGIHAKRARGLMARWAIAHRCATPESLKGFDSEGYAFAPGASSADRFVFRRQH